MGPLEFPFRVPAFADLDDLFRRHLPCDPTYRCLELGCCPGQYLWYFHNRFGYHPSGLDYLEDGCRETQARCAANELEADIIHADLFDFECNDEYPPWDVIASFGLVEHFEDIMPCLHRHIDLVRPGGYVAIVIPNHAGLNGTILRLHMPDRYRLHNLMSWADLREGLEATNRVEIIEGGHYGRIGFWNTAVYRRARKYGKIPYAAIRAPLWAIEHAGRILPNSSYFSPNIAVIARRTD
ncbi:MAG: class I SAM-dependent methyltransferase [Phycisphaerales bacterium]|nr:class I SAM-dependent methyltransferase [Phycisphaerales bacterium]